VAHVDQFFYRSLAGDAIPDRLKAVVENIPEWIWKIQKEKGFVKVLVPGSGPAQDVIKILANNVDLLGYVKFYCVDNELDALEAGKKIAELYGVAEAIEYIHGDFMKLDFSDMDLVLFIGIICPLLNRTSASVISRGVSYGRRGAYIIFSGARQIMLKMDPVICYVMHIIGWKLHYKVSNDMLWIAQKSNLSPITSFYDSKSHFHQILVAQQV
jgi:hypothetical protein